MNPKIKNILIKTIYAILFIVMIITFIYLSEKYADNSKEEVYTITDYYNKIDNDKMIPVNGTRLLALLKNGKHVIFVGSKTSKWAEKYAIEIDKITVSLGLDEVIYYDLNNDKAQKNSNYYKIRDILQNSLVTTDGSNNNIFCS